PAPVQGLLAPLQHQPGGHSRIKGVPTPLEHRHPRPRSQPVRRGDHAKGPTQLGSGRNHAVSITMEDLDLSATYQRRSLIAGGFGGRAPIIGGSPSASGDSAVMLRVVDLTVEV